MEKLLQYAWQHRLWKSPMMTATDGTEVEILDPGWLNTGAGPDFFNAKIRAGSKTWAGNIEIHTKASDWYRHGHQNDQAYDPVILHVVGQDDMTVTRRDGTPMKQVVLQCHENLTDLYNRLVSTGTADLICGDFISKISPVYLTDWIDALAFERLYEKSERFNRYMEATANDWQQSLFATLARGLGFGRNTDALERLALSTPLTMLGKHADSIGSIEAILLGQASLIDEISDPVRRQYLKQEYDFLAHKFSLTQLKSLNWQRGGSRPQNSPVRRIEQLAQYVAGGFNMMTRLLQAPTIQHIRDIFRLEGINHLPESSLNLLIINVASPAIYTYGLAVGDTSATERALDLLRSLPAENNHITQLFSNAGIECDNAYTSQALIALRRTYCENRKCLFCRIGNRMMRSVKSK